MIAGRGEKGKKEGTKKKLRRDECALELGKKQKARELKGQ